MASVSSGGCGGSGGHEDCGVLLFRFLFVADSVKMSPVAPQQFIANLVVCPIPSVAHTMSNEN